MCKQDDILVGGVSWQENIKILVEVLERLDKYSLHFEMAKCEFLKRGVVYLGLKIDAQCLHPVEENFHAVKRAPVPHNVIEFRSFLSMVQYNHSFQPDLATALAPLHELLKEVSGEHIWTNECHQGYEACKQSITSDALSVHYDGHLELRLACDASSHGIGTVIGHVLDDDQERPIAYASWTLSSSERNYAQLEREALPILFGEKKN